MLTNKNCIRLGSLVVLILLAGSATAQQTVYKWVDEEGVVHFGEAPPEGVEAERITTYAAPTPAPAAPAPQSKVEPKQQPSAPTDEAPPVAAAPTIFAMSLSELDARCDRAREAKIAPLRAAEIESCKSQPRTDPASCEAASADFGEGGRTITGAMRPRMFDDLPECVEALQERNLRGI